MKIRTIFSLLILALCSGCGSFYGRLYGPPTSAYIGVRADTGLIGEGHPVFIIDYPFSAIADTLLLPVDLWPQTPPLEPLKGWTVRPFEGFEIPPYGHDTNHLDFAITDDYQAFIAKNKLFVNGAITGYSEDGTGRHAVQFVAFPPGENATWQYDLIYDQTNKRVKVIKCNHLKYQP